MSRFVSSWQKLAITVIKHMWSTARKKLPQICAVYLMHHGKADAFVTVQNSLIIRNLSFSLPFPLSQRHYFAVQPNSGASLSSFGPRHCGPGSCISYVAIVPFPSRRSKSWRTTQGRKVCFHSLFWSLSSWSLGSMFIMVTWVLSNALLHFLAGKKNGKHDTGSGVI